MNTKEAIDKVERISNIFEADEIFKNNGIQILEVIKLLRRGGKYEKMWGEMLHQVNQIHPLHITGEDIRNIINDAKQKYFPKEANQNEAEK